MSDYGKTYILLKQNTPSVMPVIGEMTATQPAVRESIEDHHPVAMSRFALTLDMRSNETGRQPVLLSMS